MKRGGQLVCEYLENVSRKVLQEYPQLVREHVRRRHGVYETSAEALLPVPG